MLTTLALLSAIAVAVAQPSDTVRIDSDRGSRVWIEGGSNVHDWSCKAAAFDARVELAPGVAGGEATAAVVIRRVSVRLSARDLKCGNRKMENDLYTALKATDPANPSYIVGIFNADSGSAALGSVGTHGTLLVAGVEKAVSTLITTERRADGTVRARGSVPLLMTDFGVKPPVGLFGLIRSKNEVVVKFDLVIAARP